MLELVIVVALIALNGFFALSEMALVTSRKIRLKQMAETSKGRPRRWRWPSIRTTCSPLCRSASP